MARAAETTQSRRARRAGLASVLAAGAGACATSSGLSYVVPGGHAAARRAPGATLGDASRAPGRASTAGASQQSGVSLAAFVVGSAAACTLAARGAASAGRRPAVALAAKAACTHPDRDAPNLCGDCPRDQKMPCQPKEATVPVLATLDGAEVCASAAFISSAKAECIHMDRDAPNLCGDCPRDQKMPSQPKEVCASAAFISSAKAACIHMDRDAPNLCGDCPRN